MESHTRQIQDLEMRATKLDFELRKALKENSSFETNSYSSYKGFNSAIMPLGQEYLQHSKQGGYSFENIQDEIDSDLPDIQFSQSQIMQLWGANKDINYILQDSIASLSSLGSISSEKRESDGSIVISDNDNDSDFENSKDQSNQNSLGPPPALIESSTLKINFQTFTQLQVLKGMPRVTELWVRYSWRNEATRQPPLASTVFHSQVKAGLTTGFKGPVALGFEKTHAGYVDWSRGFFEISVVAMGAGYGGNGVSSTLTLNERERIQPGKAKYPQTRQSGGLVQLWTARGELALGDVITSTEYANFPLRFIFVYRKPVDCSVFVMVDESREIGGEKQKQKHGGVKGNANKENDGKVKVSKQRIQRAQKGLTQKVPTKDHQQQQKVPKDHHQQQKVPKDHHQQQQKDQKERNDRGLKDKDFDPTKVYGKVNFQLCLLPTIKEKDKFISQHEENIKETTIHQENFPQILKYFALKLTALKIKGLDSLSLIQPINSSTTNTTSTTNNCLVTLAFKIFPSDCDKTSTQPWECNNPNEFIYTTTRLIPPAPTVLPKTLILEVHVDRIHMKEIGLVKIQVDGIWGGGIIPENEYCVVGLADGRVMGWITAVGYVGEWANIKFFIETDGDILGGGLNQVKVDFDAKNKQLQDIKPEILGKPGLEVLGNENDQHEMVPGNDQQENFNKAGDFDTKHQLSLPQEPSPQSPHSHSTLQITIHRACGLYPLLESLFESQSLDKETDFLMLALDRGPNVYITLDLFPEAHDRQGEDSIQTQVVVYSFTPVFEYSIQVTVECLDTDLVRWIKEGGQAHGRIFHRVPRHLVSIGELVNQDSILIGEFKIPLCDLLGGGIQNEWFTVQNGPGAVECSLTFDGFDLGSLGVGRGLNAGSQTWLVLNIEKLCLGKDREYQAKVGYTFSKDEIDEKLVSINDGGLCIEELVDPSVSKVFFSFYASDDSFIGNVVLKLEGAIRKARIASRKPGTRTSTDLKEFMVLNVIDAESGDWNDALVHISMQIRIDRKKRSRQNPNESTFLSESFIQNIENISEIEQAALPDAITKSYILDHDPDTTFPEYRHERESTAAVEQHLVSPPPQPQLLKNLSPKKSPVKEVTIPIYITIEKAMNLPLVCDPLGDSFPSPFVKKSDSFTSTPPNSYVSLSISKGSGIITENVFTSRIITAQTSPAWTYSISADLNPDLESLEMCRKSARLYFKVWHVDEDQMEPYLENDQLLGVVCVGLEPLFTGMTDIHGWYPIKDQEGASKGQLMVRICPSENLGDLLKRLQIAKEEKLKSNMLKPFFEAQPVGGLATAEESAAETFVWTGKKWEMKRVDEISREKQPFSPGAAFSDRARKTITDTINDLDELRSSMMRKLDTAQNNVAVNSSNANGDEKNENQVEPQVVQRDLNSNNTFRDSDSNHFKLEDFSVLDSMASAIQNQENDSSVSLVADPGNEQDDTDSLAKESDPESCSDSILLQSELCESSKGQGVQDSDSKQGDSAEVISEPGFTSSGDDDSMMEDAMLQRDIGKPPLAPSLNLPVIVNSKALRLYKEILNPSATLYGSESLTNQRPERQTAAASNIEQKLANLTLESSTRMAQVLKRSTSSSLTPQ